MRKVATGLASGPVAKPELAAQAVESAIKKSGIKTPSAVSLNTMAAAAGLSSIQSSSVNMPVAEQPIICVQRAALAAALMADSGSAANSALKNRSTALGVFFLSFI